MNKRLEANQFMVAKQQNFNAAEDNTKDSRKHYVTEAFDSFLVKDSIEYWISRARNSIQWRNLQWWRSGQKQRSHHHKTTQRSYAGRGSLFREGR